MESWILDLKLGMKKLSRHEPQSALRYLRGAIKRCPVRRSADLARILFFTGVALKKIGLHDGAVNSWRASWKLSKSGPANRHLKRFSNDYGMAKQGMAELDDWRAFYSLQLSRYLKSKKSRCLGTLAEQDMIRDLIFDAWQEVKDSGVLAGRPPAEKLTIFKGVSIVFPFFVVPGGMGPGVLPAGSRLTGGGKTCPCGSGLPPEFCCGNKNRGYESLGGKF